MLLHTEEIVGFLTQLFGAGLGYSAINTARSALSALGSIQEITGVGERPLIKRFLRGIFQMRPTAPRYSTTWDVNIVLEYMSHNWPLQGITLKELTFKLVMLVALVTGQRGQSIHLMSIRNMIVKEDSVEFIIQELTKTSAPGKAQPLLVLPMYKPDVNLCVVATLNEYIVRTAQLRPSVARLLISIIKPFKPVAGSLRS